MPDTTVLAGVEVHLVETIDDAAAFLRWLGESRPVLAVDTETTGLQWWTPHFTRLVQFGDGRHGWALSVRNWRGVIAKALAEYDGPVVFHNAKFDMHALENEGLAVPPWHQVHDTKIMDHLLDPLRPHGLKPISDRMFGREATAGQAMLRQAFSKGGWNWATVPENLAAYWAYAALDTVLTALVAERLWPEVNAAGYRQAYEREMATQAILYRAENRGMKVDVDYTYRLREEWIAEATILGDELVALGVQNPSSNRQIQAALEAAGWEPEEFTPTGAAKLDGPILKALVQTYGAEIAPRVLRYRRLLKWTSAYLDHFLAAKDGDDRVHASINTMAAKTGRMSITDPPLQTLPRGPEIRDCIVPAEGKRLVAIDYDAMEFRVFAHYAQDPRMIEALLNGIDAHKFAAALAYGITIDEVTADQRQVTKNTQYGKMYGAGASKISETAGITEAEAKAFIAAYEAALPGVPAFMRKVEGVGRMRLANEGVAYVETWGGRRMVAPDDALYKLINGLIQGGCADVFKSKIIALDNAGYGDHIVLPVHDELIFEVPTEDAEFAAVEFAEIMEARDEFSVPLTVEPSKPLERWGDKYRKEKA